EGRHVDPSRRTHIPIFLAGNEATWLRYALFHSGLYPESFKYDYEKAYFDSTFAEKIILDSSSILTVQLYQAWTPLSFTLTETKFSFYPTLGYNDSHILFIGNWESYADWLEFWNLRCFGSQILFVPYTHPELFDPNTEEYLKAGNYPLNQNPADQDQ